MQLNKLTNLPMRRIHNKMGRPSHQTVTADQIPAEQAICADHLNGTLLLVCPVKMSRSPVKSKRTNLLHMPLSNSCDFTCRGDVKVEALLIV